MSSETSPPSASSVDLSKLLEESGAIQKGHFILSSGRHSDTYVEKFRILEMPEVLSALCAQIADHFRYMGVQIVAGPTTGGIIIAFEVARQLGCSAVYVESQDGVKKLRRGAQIAPGAQVLIVDDVLTTGKSLFEVADVVNASGGKVAGAAVLIDRSEAPVAFGVPIFAAHRVSAESFPPDAVPESLRKVPQSKPGTRPEVDSGLS